MSGILGEKTENQKKPLCRFLAFDEGHEPFAMKRRKSDFSLLWNNARR